VRPLFDQYTHKYTTELAAALSTKCVRLNTHLADDAGLCIVCGPGSPFCDEIVHKLAPGQPTGTFEKRRVVTTNLDHSAQRPRSGSRRGRGRGRSWRW